MRASTVRGGGGEMAENRIVLESSNEECCPGQRVAQLPSFLAAEMTKRLSHNSYVTEDVLWETGSARMFHINEGASERHRV